MARAIVTSVGKKIGMNQLAHQQLEVGVLAQTHDAARKLIPIVSVAAVLFPCVVCWEGLGTRLL